MNSGLAPALDARSISVPVDRHQLERKFKRALIVDDEVEYAHSVREHLEYIGFEAQVVGSLDAAAQKLHETSYPLVICDNIFVDRAKKRGSEFIRDHDELFSQGDVILMTGYPERNIIDADILRGRGVQILQKKGTGSIDQLKELCMKLAEAQIIEFMRRLSAVLADLIPKIETEHDLESLFSDSYLLKKGRTYLLNYLKKFPDQDLPQFVINGMAHSAKSLISEIEIGSDLSRELVDQLLDDALE